MSGLAAASLALSKLPVMAGPFTKDDFEKLVPADKKLSPDWVKSLFERGFRTKYHWPESQLIGLPIGGICCGQLYLGGDGKLWHWDIFNRVVGTGDGHYAHPPKPASPLDQGFALRIAQAGKSQVRALDNTGWGEVEFIGEYPIGLVEYRDPASPVSVSLQAFSPFIPLNTEDSALPATVMQFTVKNASVAPVEAELTGWLENAVCLHSAAEGAGQHRNRIVRRQLTSGHPPSAIAGYTFLECSAEAAPSQPRAEKRPDIVFDDFEKQTYDGWTVTGTAFGNGPVEQDKMPDYQGKVGARQKRLVNSHASAPGTAVGEKDAATGTLVSRPFLVERDYITFLIGGGAHKGKTCVNFLVDDQVALSAIGKNDNRLAPHTWDARKFAGRTARLQIVDDEKGGWGNIGIDDIVFSDEPRAPLTPLTEAPDFGTMVLALLKSEISSSDSANASLPNATVPPNLFSKSSSGADDPATKPFGQKHLGSLTRHFTLAPGASTSVTFVIAWHFPNLKLSGLGNFQGRHYGKRFPSAIAVADYVAQHFDRLASQTRLWHDTWYDSTLPYWFLDRTMAPTSHLATNTCYWLGNGRFYAWEGVGCCPGTCTHVWHYAHAVARLFPKLERSLREMADYGAGFDANTGRIRFRAEHNDHWAVDGQAGVVLRTWREHQMSADDAFLRGLWPRIKKALQFLISKDTGLDGIIDGPQHNTLDADWHGQVAWLSSLYLAALRAGEEMARELDQAEFANKCRDIFDKGCHNVQEKLFNGEYFFNRVDPAHLDAINSGAGCHIDQVFGDSWAWQVGLGRILEEDKTKSALRALWRYNFAPDVGPFRAANKPGRWYAMPGEAGLLMCTFPRHDWDYVKAAGKGPGWAAGYFNECMNGFEYQVAGHMVWEGMLLEGLAITRAVHDRYLAPRRNPWNEVECGDHYARSMASYGVFLAACGFQYHGPKRRLGFAPRLTPENFQCAFTTAEGWGAYSQKFGTQNSEFGIHLKWGKLRLRTLCLALQPGFRPTKVTVAVAGKTMPATLAVLDAKVEIKFDTELVVNEGEKVEVEMS
jgi:uncharacterized protein (DUF608 family)